MVSSKKENSEKVKEIQFPILMEHLTLGSVVLFTDERTGIFIHKTGSNGISSTEYIGSYSNALINPADIREWRVYSGKIILENSYET